MASAQTIAIVGAGQAGGWAAVTLRQEGFDGDLLLIGDEDHPPYERPPLSKAVLLGDATLQSTYLWPPGELDAQRVARVHTAATGLNTTTRELELADGTRVGYSKLLLATGGRVRKLLVPGADLPGIHYLRTIEDAATLRARLQQHNRVLIVGGGWIGLEAAAAARTRGLETTVVEAADQLCPRALTPGFAGHVRALHEQNGVDIRLDSAITGFGGDTAVEHANLGNGERIETALIIVGIGIVPNTDLARAAGLAVDNGIVVDAHGRTSDPNVFAAGDVANHPNDIVGRRIRLESWANAQNQAIATARAMLCDDAPAYCEVPWFWSDQYDTNIQLVGMPEQWDNEITRGDIASGAFVTFYLKGDRIVGAAACNAARDLRLAGRVMTADKPVTADELADPGVKLQAILKR